MGKHGFGGFGGGMNMQAMMKQAQKMQQDMLKAKEELAELEVTGTSGGGMVEVTMTCDMNVTGVKIKPEAVDPDDVEMLEDLIIAAFNEAQSLAKKESDERMGAFAGLGL
ncbi:MAG: YbaB/EbfC family nucleoid-associated protein [Clostridia bacterium]|nr:YbaB/EbfC family nucleoid-associated protein [Clostridia bacterium]